MKFEGTQKELRGLSPKNFAMLQALVKEELKHRIARPPAEIIEQVLTSGFNKEVLRLNAFDQKFMRDCGIAVE